MVRKTIDDYPPFNRGDVITAELMNEIMRRLKAEQHGRIYNDSDAAVISFPPVTPGSGGAGITFAADAAFTINDGTWQATVVEKWGDADNAGTTVTILNLEIDPGVYMFKGDLGAVGIAWKMEKDKEYRCLQLECSPGELPSDWTPV